MKVYVHVNVQACMHMWMHVDQEIKVIKHTGQAVQPTDKQTKSQTHAKTDRWTNLLLGMELKDSSRPIWCRPTARSNCRVCDVCHSGLTDKSDTFSCTSAACFVMLSWGTENPVTCQGGRLTECTEVGIKVVD